MTRKVPFDDGEVRVPLFKEYGSWLDKFLWSHYAILTFYGHPTCKEAWRMFNRRKRAMAKAMSAKIEYLFIYDNEHPDEPHIHLLLAGCEGMNTDHWAEEWEKKVGMVKKLVRYDPKKGARFYMGKKFLRDDCEVILSSGLRSTAELDMLSDNSQN